MTINKKELNDDELSAVNGGYYIVDKYYIFFSLEAVMEYGTNGCCTYVGPYGSVDEALNDAKVKAEEYYNCGWQTIEYQVRRYEESHWLSYTEYYKYPEN